MEKILIVEDDPEMLMLLSMLVRKNTPYDSVFTNNVLEAVEMLKKRDCDLVITEMKMPVIDGIEFLDIVRQFDRNVPVIIVSAYGNVESAVDAMNKGCFEYIMKPFRKEQMLYAVHNAMELSRLKKENTLLKMRLGITATRMDSGVLLQSPRHTSP